MKTPTRSAVYTLMMTMLLTSALPLSSTAREFTLPRAEFLSPRALGMGGAFTALSNDRNLFFTNPAGLAYVPKAKFGFEILPTTINNNTIRAFNFYTDNQDTFEGLNDLSDSEQATFYDDILQDIGGNRSEASTHIPVYLLLPAPEGSLRPHLGFGFFAGSNVDFLSMSGAAGIPNVEFNIGVQYTGVATAAYSWDTLLPGKLTAGGSVKFDRRNISRNSKSILALSENEQIDMLNATSMGFDVGAIYEISPNLRVGASIFDIVSGDFEFEGQDRSDPLDILNDGDIGTVEASLVVGGAYYTGQNFLLLQGLTLTFDIREPFDEDRSFWRGLHLGAESRVLFFDARFGFFEGYPGAGFGLGPIQYAYYSNEVGRFPGARSNYAHTVSLAF